ncbi:hypothetical protein ACJIZ3_023333 [Penstemon smallii]|uniref:Uncharacterized protein n=1 Tax=Penstemon smallii TaxID=265156 RepID=A0ABD3TNT4_9LAMI
MVSEAMSVQEQYGITGLDTFLPPSDRISLDMDDDFAPKVRKVYTITKQRERWTQEEHKKFLDALKLHGRAWRKIEEHVGSKTAVQIRSHAQKFFSKVVRESNTDDSSSTKPIEIPPPRPKRKPMHPYPRKSVSPLKNGILVPEKPNRSTSPNLSQSPTSVLSSVSSEILNISEEARSSGPSHEHDEDSKELSLSSFKLFGKILLVENPQGPVYSTRFACKPESLDTSEETGLLDSVSWLTLCGNASLPTLGVHNPTPIKAWGLFDRKESTDIDEDKEVSMCSTGSNTDLVRPSSDGEKNCDVDSSPFSVENKRKFGKSFSSSKLSMRSSENSCRKGFVPYKRCFVEKACR